MTITRFCLCLSTLAVTASFTVGYAAEPKFKISVNPEQPSFAQGEAVLVDITVINDQGIAEQINREGEWESMLNISLILNGATVSSITKKSEIGGMQASGFEEFKPGQSKTIQIVLNQKFSVKREGKYDVLVTLGSNQGKGSFMVSQGDAEALKVKFGFAWAKYKDPGTAMNKKSEMVKKLVYSEHPSAIQFQEELFNRRHELTFDNLSDLIQALVRTHRADVIDYMLKALTSDRSDNNVRRLVFYGIKSEGLDSFDSQTKGVLAPYLKQIEASRPLEVID